MRRWIAACLVAGTISVGMTVSVGASPEDLRHPDQQASCVGLIAADHARGIPDGTHISEVIEGVRDYTDAAGASPGTFIGSLARQHLGSHAVCGNE